MPEETPRPARRRVRWGVLGVAHIATKRVIPVMRDGESCEIVAIASRDAERARQAAEAFGIPRAYGAYDALLDDPGVDAVYNPLPNHLHVPLSIRALERGKHVLVEKPVAVSAAEAETLLAARERTGLQVAEAFMVRSHPQWLRALELVRSGRIGALRAVNGAFTYANHDPANVRNVRAWGGGALLDVGSYLITMSRLLFGDEPTRVLGLSRSGEGHEVDRLTSAILEFAAGQAVFTCSMEIPLSQGIWIFGTRGHVAIERPWSPPADRPTRIVVDDGRDLLGGGAETIELPPCDHYRIQGELFSKAILDGGAVAVPLEDSIRNMRVIEAVARSALLGNWQAP